MRQSILTGTVAATLTALSLCIAPIPPSSARQEIGKGVVPKVLTIKHSIHLRYTSKLYDVSTTPKKNPGAEAFAKMYLPTTEYWSDGKGCYLLRSESGINKEFILRDSADTVYQMSYYLNALSIFPAKADGLHNADLQMWYQARKAKLFSGFEMPETPYINGHIETQMMSAGWMQTGIISNPGAPDKQVTLRFDVQKRLIQYESKATDRPQRDMARFSDFTQVGPQEWIPAKILYRSGNRAKNSKLPFDVILSLKSFDTKAQTANYLTIQNPTLSPKKGTTILDYRYMLGEGRPLTYDYVGTSSIDEESKAEYLRQKQRDETLKAK